MSSVIIFGPTGKAGSAAAVTAAGQGATVWLAMRNTEKEIPGLTKEEEKAGDYHRIQADLSQPETVAAAIKTSGAKRAFIYLVHLATDHMRSVIEALKNSGVQFVVFLSSFTIPTNKALRDIPREELIPYVHAQVEANLDDVFGDENYVALRPGAFVTNLLAHKKGIVEGKISLHGGVFEQDNIVPSDIGRVAGVVLVWGARNSQKKVYLYGPEILSTRDSLTQIGKTLGKEVEVTDLDSKTAFEKYIGNGMPEPFAKYMIEVHSTNGTDKGSGEIFPKYEEGVKNVELYTDKPSTSLEEWTKANKALFEA